MLPCVEYLTEGRGREMGTKKAVCVLAAVALFAGAGWASQTGDAVKAVADMLQSEQVKADGVFPRGSWPHEVLFTGSITSGMVGAYQMLGDKAYLTSAEMGTSLILHLFSPDNDPNGLFYGDQAYAMARVSKLPGHAPWIESVQETYEWISWAGTEAYVD